MEVLFSTFSVPKINRYLGSFYPDPNRALDEEEALVYRTAAQRWQLAESQLRIMHEAFTENLTCSIQVSAVVGW